MTVETTTLRVASVEETTVVVAADAQTVVRAVEKTTVVATGEIGPVGATGSEGDIGPTGLSAYEVALLEGFVGTEEQWLESLVGPQGLPGGSYRHVQNSTSASWVIVHSLGFEPNVSVVDSGGTNVVGDVSHDSVSQLTVTFSVAFSGTAYLS